MLFMRTHRTNNRRDAEPDPQCVQCQGKPAVVLTLVHCYTDRNNANGQPEHLRTEWRCAHDSPYEEPVQTN